MRTKWVGVSLVLAVLVVFAAVSMAGEEVTLSGKVTCAKCMLKKAGAKECQDVLVVTGTGAGEYYVVKNAVFEKFGHVCQGDRGATVTGTVAEKDGQKWITATKIEAAKG
jgi:hypothetical protein